MSEWEGTVVRALAPVRAELLRRAREAAARTVAAAEQDAGGHLAEARTKAAEILAEARDQGVADARAVLAAQRIRSRRAARTRELDAQREAYEKLRDHVVRALRDLTRSADYPVLREAIVDRARTILGADAVISEAPSGGLVAVTADRRVDYSFDALANWAFDRFGARVEGLWAP